MRKIVLLACVCILVPSAFAESWGGTRLDAGAPDGSFAPFLAQRQADLSASRELLDILGGSGSRLDRLFDAGRMALDMRAALLPEEARPLIEQEHRNLDAARELLGLAETGDGNNLGRAVALAKTATRWQAETLGFGGNAPVEPPAHALPSEALLALAVRYGATPGPEQDLEAFDALPERLRGALTRFLDAFLTFDKASRRAFADADLAQLDALAAPDSIPAGAPGDPLRSAGVDLAPVFPARNAFLDAILDLDDALADTPLPASHGPSLKMAPVFSIDLLSDPDTFEAQEDYVLVLDVGGDDTYLNNAGGNNLDGGVCEDFPPALQFPVAALVDLGGDDTYGGLSPRSCGATGGGRNGVGFLLDAAGTDAYTAGSLATNGGAMNGVGFLLDAGGADTYLAGNGGTNGGSLHGSGLLLDADGVDTYTAGSDGTNGGGRGNGAGMLLDAGLEGDVYLATTSATNGGSNFGAGFLLDRGGADTYTAGGSGANGGAHFGAGFLLDAGTERDVYVATDAGTNGGGAGRGVADVVHRVGVGFLLDAGGPDSYTAGNTATNGGGYWAGAGFLIDGGLEADAYVATGIGVNGGAYGGLPAPPAVRAPIATGFLLDAGGDDDYTAAPYGTNGGGYGLGSGFLLDAGGNDDYLSTRVGTNGGGAGFFFNGAPVPGSGFLYDAAGDDTYEGQDTGVNGGANIGVGILMDTGGDDTYTATTGGVNGGAIAGVALLADAGGGSDSWGEGTGHACANPAPCTVFLAKEGFFGTRLDT